LAFYVQLRSLRRAARALSEIHRISKTPFGGKLGAQRGKHGAPRMPRRLVALDEAYVKVNGLECWVYAAMDVDANEALSMRIFPSRNVLATDSS
jgi:hypothetical protein